MSLGGEKSKIVLIYIRKMNYTMYLIIIPQLMDMNFDSFKIS